MFRSIRGAALGVALVCVLSDTGAAQGWIAIRLSNFLFLSDGPEGRLRATVRKLEELRRALEEGPSRLRTTSPVPTVVFVFRDMKRMASFQPVVPGTGLSVAGYFQPNDEVNFLAITPNDRAFEVVFHEYLHFLIDNTEGETPLWYREGLAQVYQTLTVERNGTTAVVGAPPDGHLSLLRRTPLMPLGQLLHMSEIDDAYRDVPSRDRFYAQSWALMHYLRLGSGPRAAQLDDYLALVQSGASPDQAFAGAFAIDPAVLEEELRQYLQRFPTQRQRVVLRARVADHEIPRGQPIDTAEAEAHLGDLLARTARASEARETLEQLLASNGNNARAAAALGSLEIRQSRFGAGLPLLEHAARLQPDDARIQTSLGLALYDQAQRQWDPITAPGVLQRARRLLTRVVTLDPDMAPAHLALGYTEMVTGDLERAADSIGRAIALAPARKDYRIALARVHLRRRAYDRAEAELQPLVTRAPVQIRSAARVLLEIIANDRQAGALSASAVPPPRTLGGSGIPALRPLRDGEQTVIGRLTAVDCRAALSRFLVQTDGGDWWFGDSLGGAQLTTYRSDAPRAIGCGALADALRVRLTYRPAASELSGPSGETSAAADQGTATAIEILPD